MIRSVTFEIESTLSGDDVADVSGIEFSTGVRDESVWITVPGQKAFELDKKTFLDVMKTFTNRREYAQDRAGPARSGDREP